MAMAIDSTAGSVVDHSTDALRVAGLMPRRNNYLYDLHLVVWGLAVCLCEFKSL